MLHLHRRSHQRPNRAEPSSVPPLLPLGTAPLPVACPRPPPRRLVAHGHLWAAPPKPFRVPATPVQVPLDARGSGAGSRLPKQLPPPHPPQLWSPSVPARRAYWLGPVASTTRQSLGHC